MHSIYIYNVYSAADVRNSNRDFISMFIVSLKQCHSYPMPLPYMALRNLRQLRWCHTHPPSQYPTLGYITTVTIAVETLHNIRHPAIVSY